MLYKENDPLDSLASAVEFNHQKEINNERLAEQINLIEDFN